MFATAEKKKIYPWVDCIGHFVYIRPLGINIIREFLLAPRSEHFHLDNVRKLEMLHILPSSDFIFESFHQGTQLISLFHFCFDFGDFILS